MQGNEETDVLTGRAARSESTQQQLGVRLDAVERRQLTQLDEMGLVRSNGKLLRFFLVDRRFSLNRRHDEEACCCRQSESEGALLFCLSRR